MNIDAVVSDRHVVSPLSWWRDHISPFPAFRLVTNNIAAPERTRWTNHQHREHELLWGIAGEVMVETPFGVTVVPSAVQLWIPAWVPHEVTAAAGSTLACTWFEPDCCSIGWPAPAVVAVDPLLTGVLEHLGDLDLAEERRRTAEAFAFDLLVPAPQWSITMPMPTTPGLRRVALEILACPGDDRGLGELSAAAHLSVRSFTRLFSRETALSFAQWRVRARMQRALQLLSEGTAVGATGRMVGYANQSAFIAAFTRVVGSTPGALRTTGTG